MHIWYEDTHGRPGRPAVSEFQFGRYYGAQIAACRFAAQMSPEEVLISKIHPSTWKTFYDLKKKPKEASIPLARLIVGMETANDNLADSALIAAYGLSQATKS